MKKNVFFLILIISCLYFFIVKAISQSNISHVPDEMVFKTEVPFNSIDLLNSIIVTDQSWFNKLAIQFEINELEPIFGTTSPPRLYGWYKIKFKAKIKVYTIVSIFQQQSAVLKTEPNGIGRFFTSTPNDTYYSSQWNLAHIQMPLAWDITSGSAQVIVAVIDGGIRTTQEDLVAQLWINPNEIANGSDDDDNGYVDDINGIFTNTWNTGQTQTLFNPADLHGTQVASVCCASTNNAKGIAGIAGGGFGGQIGARLMIIRVPWSSTPGTTDAASIARGVGYATQKGAHIVNMSLGFQSGYAPIQDAILVGVETGRGGKGIIYTAGSGNVDNPPQWPNYGEAVFPASMGDVIAVGSIDQSGLWYYTSNYANWLDVVAPGKNIWVATGGTDNSYAGNGIVGTSYAAPHAAGLAALILSINSNFTLEEVTNIINNTATNISDPDRTGHGVINPYQSLLMALAYANQTQSSFATVYNSGRRLMRASNNKYHLVFESGGEIFYRRSNVGGTSWETPIRFSSGNSNHKYPSITGTSTKQFVVWQRYTGYAGGQHKYDTYCAKNTGSGWTTTTISNLSNLGFSTQTDPRPVVTYKTRSGGYRLLVCIKTSSAIKFVTSDNDGTTWSTASNLPSTSSSHQNPSLSMGPNTPASTVYASYDDGNNVYYHTYVSAWGTAVNISSGSGTTSNRYPSVEVDGNGGKNFAWQGYSTPLEMTMIVHRRNRESFQIFANGGDGGNRPSITGLTSNKRAIVCTSDNFADIFKLYYNGSSWSQTLVANNGQHPNLSAGTTTAKYVWTSGTAAPYEIKISSESLSKSSLENWAYHRVAVLQDTANATLLWIELGEITLATSQQEFAIAQTSIQNQDLNLQATELFHYLDSEPFVIPADSSRLIWYQQLYGQGLSQLTAAPTRDLKITTQLIDAVTESALATLHQTVLVSSSDSSRSTGLLSHNVSAYNGQPVKFRVAVAGLATKMAGIVPGVTEIHFLNPTGFGKPHPKENDEPSAAKPKAFMLSQNFPNPFNATTEIHYQLPAAVQVRLVIYTVLGQELRTLVDREESAGWHTIRWDGKDAQAQELVSGIYIYQIEAGTFIDCKKLVLIR